MALAPVTRDDPPSPAIDSFENELRRATVTTGLVQHAGLILTLSYAFLAVVGMMYNFFYFAAFGINVLEYSETSDFIVAAVQSPFVILLCLLPALIIWIAVIVRRSVRRVSPRYDAYAARHEAKYGRRYLAFFRLVIPLLVLSYAALFTLKYAQYTSGRIIHGRGRGVHITRTTPNPADSSAKLLVGTTSKYLFFYDTLAHSTDIIPADNVAAISVALPVRPKPK